MNTALPSSSQRGTVKRGTVSQLYKSVSGCCEVIGTLPRKRPRQKRSCALARSVVAM